MFCMLLFSLSSDTPRPYIRLFIVSVKLGEPHCDPIEIQQVIINLINNARDALEGSQSKIISITIDKKSLAECPNNETCEICSANVAHIIVKDTGSGINKTDLLNIFDPFFTTKEVGKGTGLGLSMSKGAIESHGGVFNVSSEVGIGTKFEICLPLTAAPLNEGTENIDTIQATNNETILVIEDEKIISATLSQLLTSLGYKVIIAKNGELGVRKFLDNINRVSLVISDVVMPVMDGHTAIAEIRNAKPLLPVIFITGYDSIKQLTHDKLTTTVTKPFKIAELSHLIHDYLRKSEKSK